MKRKKNPKSCSSVAPGSPLRAPSTSISTPELEDDGDVKMMPLGLKVQRGGLQVCHPKCANIIFPLQNVKCPQLQEPFWFERAGILEFEYMAVRTQKAKQNQTLGLSRIFGRIFQMNKDLG